MAQELRERNEMDPAYQWDLSTLYADDDAWEQAFTGLGQRIDAVCAFEGKTEDAQSIRALLEAETDLDLLLSDLFAYANLRRSEDTRAPQA